jgi:hypothetical protein
MSTSSGTADPNAIRSFGQLVGILEDGALQAALSDQTVELMATLQKHANEHGGKPKGKLVLTIDFLYANGMVDVEAETKITKPKDVRRRTTLYTTAGGGLSRANPQQQSLDLRTVAPDGAVKAV